MTLKAKAIEQMRSTPSREYSEAEWWHLLNNVHIQQPFGGERCGVEKLIAQEFIK